ncbi:MAG: NADH:ubiquinone oxidoreductase [Candelina submexicana]|nr:MAG: NADH:ubiquinone oxidoreductase [Candelina submexicana]
MPSLDDTPSSPPSASASPKEALAYYKSQYEQLEQELAEFQASSRELEAELEKDVEASEKRERQLREKVESLGFEVDEWKTKYKQSKAEANSAQNTLQKEITTLRDTNRAMQLQLRDIEVANDDFEKQARNTSSSLEDLESKYNISIERGVMLEEEMNKGEQERETLRIETQRLRDELSDLRIEAEINQGKLRHSEAAAERQHSKKHQPSPAAIIPPQSPISETSPATTTSSPTTSTPPRPKSSSTVASDTPTPPSPPISERSTPAYLSSTPHQSKRLARIDSNTTPRPSQQTLRPPRHSRGPSFPVSHGRSTQSIQHRTLAKPGEPQAQGLPHSSSLHQIRGLIGKMQKLEQRVHSARSKLPAPTFTSPGASPRSGSPKSQSFVPASVTVRSNKKRTGGSIATGASSIREAAETTPLSAHHVSRLSFGGPPASNNRHTDSRPSSKGSVASHSSTGQFAIPSSRASTTRTPQGHRSSQVISCSSNAEGRRPRSSIGGSYASMHGHGHSASVSTAEEKNLGFSTPTPRRTTLDKNALIQGSAIPTPTGLVKRQSGGANGGGFGLAKTTSSRRTNSALGFREGERSMAPPERRRKLSGVGETF